MRRPNLSNGVMLSAPADAADAAAVSATGCQMLIRTSLADVGSRTLFDLKAVDECAPQAVVDHDERRHGHFAGLGFRRQRVFGDAADLGVFALELAAVFEQQRLAVGGAAARERYRERRQG